MIDKRYCKKDSFGRETFDHRAYEDNEQMQILSQMNKSKKGHLMSHRILSFFRRGKAPISNVR